MKSWTRKKSSQRRSKSMPITLEENWAGQGGHANLVIDTAAGWQVIEIETETEAEARQLMSLAACIFHNIRERRVA